MLIGPNTRKFIYQYKKAVCLQRQFWYGNKKSQNQMSVQGHRDVKRNTQTWKI